MSKRLTAILAATICLTASVPAFAQMSPGSTGGTGSNPSTLDATPGAPGLDTPTVDENPLIDNNTTGAVTNPTTPSSPPVSTPCALSQTDGLGNCGLTPSAPQ